MSFIKKHRNGSIGTVAFHLIIALIFILLGFTPPPEEFPPVDERGLLIDFGDSDRGLGEIEPESADIAVTSDNKSSQEEEEIMTQDHYEAPAIQNTGDDNSEEETDNTDDEEEETPEVNEKALFTGNNNSDSEGITGGDGNQGHPDGADTDNYYGDPNGDGYSLGNRKLIGKLPKPAYPPGNVSGKVVLNIKVDKHGVVISVGLGKGCTTDNAELIRAAKQAAWKAKFNKDYNSVVQVGTITYNFVLQ